ncbi:MAG TPA: response regulator [Acidobacteriota bacterium]|nr:response regulator [Acidobacteriota bacterium]
MNSTKSGSAHYQKPALKPLFYTTFEISQICGVNPTTVQNWVKGKKLKAFQTPGGHRRIRREDLISFMKEFGMPFPDGFLQNPPLAMIVDDENDILDMLEDLLKSGESEINVVRAQSGIAALLMIGEYRPDLLILDIMMPGMNGYEVCRKLKANSGTQNIKIVAISGDHSPAVRDRILNAGADLFFTKPLDIVSFREQCFSLLPL